MVKTKYKNRSISHPQLGVFPKLETKKIPNTGLRADGSLDFSLVMDEEEKVDDNYAKLKDMIIHYEWIGRQQVKNKSKSITKKFNLANGIIDTDDYISGTSDYSAELNMLGNNEELDYDLKFYPIIPPIVNTIVNERFKHHTEFMAMAVNPEATNMVIEEKNNAIRELLIAPLQAQFEAGLSEQGIDAETQPAAYQQQQEIFNQLPKVQEYYAKSYRLGVEKWASNQLVMDEKRFNFKSIEKNALRNKVVADSPYTHIRLDEDDYVPEVIDPRFAYYLRSPNVEDVSESVMFGWFEYESPINVIQRFGHKLSEKDMEKLEELDQIGHLAFNINTKSRYDVRTNGVLEAAQNVIAFNEIKQRGKNKTHRPDEYKERLIEISNMYLQVPRKLGTLTMKSGEETFVTIIDDTYKPTYKATYNTTYTKDKNADTLVEGEHIEWFYINELWRCTKINITAFEGTPVSDNSENIYIDLEKFPVQIPPMGKKYGSIIPVFGGPTTNKYNSINSYVDKCANWQIFYNYLWNRNEQLIKGELGKFFALNQNLIPQESMGEEWGQNNILKWASVVRDVKIAPYDNSSNSLGGTTLAATGGYGQVVDLTVTDEVLQKAKLAEVCKNECLMSLGISPQLLGDMSPDETATGVRQGVSKSITQLKDLYEGHFETMCKVKTTMLEFARYMAVKKGITHQNYVSNEGERIIFEVPNDLLLHQLGIFVTSDMDESILLENLKTIAFQDNTMGADVLDKIGILSSKSVGAVYEKLKEAEIKRNKRQEEINNQEMAKEKQILDAQQQQIQMKLDAEARENELNRQNDLRVAEMKVIGATQFSEGGGLEELIKLRDLQLKESSYYQDFINNSNSSSNNSEKLSLERKKSDDKNTIEREKIQLQREKIMADLKKSKDALQIAKVNK